MLQKRIYVIYMYTLKNKLLVAMPNMADPYFSKSVIFICEYNKNGAIGFIINKPISTMKVLSSGIKDNSKVLIAKYNWATKEDPGLCDYRGGNYGFNANALVYKKIKGFKPILFEPIERRK